MSLRFRRITKKMRNNLNSKSQIPNSKQLGFTLIELLVVIAIIGLLASVITVALNGSRAKARDAKVKADIHQIVQALQLARDANPSNIFPGTSGSWQCLKSSGTCWYGSYPTDAGAVAALSPYMASVPKPPEPSGTYMYDAYLYLPNYTGTIGGYGPGTFIIYALEQPFPNDCRGYYAGQYNTGYYYCYMLIDTN